jgi:F-type H+-transporting ATPase subunit delta
MGSATREALASAVATLDSVSATAELATGEQLLDAGRIIGSSSQLRAALADHSVDDADKRSIIGKLFASYTPAAQGVLESVATGRWSTEDDLLAGIEELGIRALAASAGEDVSIETELFEFSRAISSNSQLELAVGSKLGSTDSKVALIGSLLAGKASAQTLAIVRHLVSQPRDRRIGELLRTATTIVAAQAGRSVATVTSAAPLAADQLDRLEKGLAGQYGTGLRINHLVDPSLIGGVRVQIGDEVIDGTIATKLNDLRLQLAR